MNIKDFFAKNWKILAGSLAVVAVVLGLASVWKERGRAQERQATNLLYQAQTSARALSAQKKFPDAEQAYQPVLEKFPKSRAAYEASLQLGDMWMEAGTFDQAIKRYEQAVEIAHDSFSKLLARYNLGIALESAGKFAEAVASYQDALKVEGADFLKPEILMAEARCYEALKDAAKAIGVYQTIQKDFANRSYYSGAASAFEKQLQSGAESGHP